MVHYFLLPCVGESFKPPTILINLQTVSMQSQSRENPASAPAETLWSAKGLNNDRGTCKMLFTQTRIVIIDLFLLTATGVDGGWGTLHEFLLKKEIYDELMWTC